MRVVVLIEMKAKERVCSTRQFQLISGATLEPFSMDPH